MIQILNAISIAGIGLILATPVFGDDVLDLTVYNNEVKAQIELANGIGADVTVSFENPQGLTLSSIGLDADLVDPTDLGLLARLPGSLVSPSSAFPMRLTIEPPEAGTLAFYGVATVEIHTHNLGYSVASPFRLFVAEDGGDFEDITDQAGSGSYRVRGSRGEFSEFMIVADLRNIDDVIGVKFDTLESILNDHQSLISGSSLFSELSDLLSAARNAYDGDDEVTAIKKLSDFVRLTRTNAGGAIPNYWRARDDIINLDGLLRSAASTLRYSLTLLANDLP